MRYQKIQSDKGSNYLVKKISETGKTFYGFFNETLNQFIRASDQREWDLAIEKWKDSPVNTSFDADPFPVIFQSKEQIYSYNKETSYIALFEREYLKFKMVADNTAGKVILPKEIDAHMIQLIKFVVALNETNLPQGRYIDELGINSTFTEIAYMKCCTIEKGTHDIEGSIYNAKFIFEL